ncbi:MAG: hypothetical protein MUC83_15035 [Pirellula sp.]|nr:hypothetical protein [Pirellula sp.]
MNPSSHLLVYAPESERFSTTLESFADQVSGWPGLYFEMDGSFVWAVRQGDESVGQIDGMIYDRDEAIEYLDLKGNAPNVAWEKLLRVLLDKDAPHGLDVLRIFEVSSGTYLKWSQIASREKS